MRIDPFDKINSDLPPLVEIPWGSKIDLDGIIGDLEDLETHGDWAARHKVARNRGILVPYLEVNADEAEAAAHLLSKRPVAKRLLDEFPGHIAQAVISVVSAGKVFKVHSDLYKDNGEPRPKFELFNTTLRIHVTLKTNDKAFMYVDGKFYHMGAGKMYMLDNYVKHAVVNNNSEEDRYHLIFDVVPNDETVKLISRSSLAEGFVDEALEQHVFTKSGI